MVSPIENPRISFHALELMFISTAATKALAEAQSWKLEVDAKVAKAKSIDWPGCASTLGQIKIGLENLGKGQSSFGQSCIIVRRRCCFCF